MTQKPAVVLISLSFSHRGTIIKRANRYIAFRGEESTVAENKEYFPEKNKEYSNKYKTIFPHIKRTSKYFFELTFFSRKTVLRREQIHSIYEKYLYSLKVPQNRGSTV